MHVHMFNADLGILLYLSIIISFVKGLHCCVDLLAWRRLQFLTLSREAANTLKHRYLIVKSYMHGVSGIIVCIYTFDLSSNLMTCQEIFDFVSTQSSSSPYCAHH